MNALNSINAYAIEQYQGLTANAINQTGFLGVVDKVWLITTRIKTVMLIGTVLMTVIFAIVKSLSKKESFAPVDNAMDAVRAKIGDVVKRFLYI